MQQSGLSNVVLPERARVLCTSNMFRYIFDYSLCLLWTAISAFQHAMSLARSRAVMVHPQHVKNARTAGHIQKPAVKVRSPTSYCIETQTKYFPCTHWFFYCVCYGKHAKVCFD